MSDTFFQKYNGINSRELLVSSHVCYGFGFSEFLSRHIQEIFEPEKRALDVGVGAGTITLDLLDYGLHVDGIDLNNHAVNICRQNLKSFGYQDCNIKKCNIAEYQSEKKYDYIVTNPPVSIKHDIPRARALESQIIDGNIDWNAFEFLTNRWCDQQGLDLLDYCFINGKYLLSEGGKIVIVCGNPCEDVLDFVIQKSHKYDYKLVQEICKKMKPLDIGLDDEGTDEFLAKIFVFEKLDCDEYYKATLTLNYSCNNRCYWCYARNVNHSKRIMSKSDMEKCIKTISELKIKRCQIIGGEPLIYPYLLDTIRLLQQESIEIFIATNGRRLANKTFFDSIIQYDICSFDLSIQGLSKSDYIANTGVDGFDDYLKAVEYLQEKNIHFVNTFVITEIKEERIIELFDFVKRYRIDNLIIEFEKGVVGSSACHLKVKECAQFVETVFKIFKNSGIHYTIATSFPLCLIDRSVLLQLIEKQCISTACHVQRKNILTIDPECHLLPCSAFVDYPFDDNKAVLKGARYVRQYMNTNSCDEFYNRSRVYPSDNCTDCEFWDLCGGGCFVRWFFEDPSDVIVNKEHKQSPLSKLLATHHTGTATAAPESMRNPYTGIDSKY